MRISIVEFSIENYKIFKEKATFSMNSRKNDAHTFESNGENLLRTSLIYGPNASGKTTLLEAFGQIRDSMILSANNIDDSLLPHEPFLADTDTPLKPTYFEVVFSANGTHKGIYRFSFSYLGTHIVTESLVQLAKNGGEKMMFSRKGQSISVGDSFKDAKILVDRTRKEALFISVAAQFNIPFANSLIEALRLVSVISGIRHVSYRKFTMTSFKESATFRKKLLEYLKKADFCISDGEARDEDAEEKRAETSLLKKTINSVALFLKHPIWNGKGEVVSHFELPLTSESSGTNKFVSILGPIISTLEEGNVLCVDEFDNSLHPKLTKFIVDLFESRDTNKKNAQLIATTHDTSLLSYKDDFIRDQFWFTEKNETGAAKLFSLAEFDLRNDTEYGKKYLEGRFGALPFIGSVDK